MLPSFRHSTGRPFVFFFSFFCGKQRDFSASEQHETLEGCVLQKKNYMETFSYFPKQKMLRGLLLRENSSTGFAKAEISEFPQLCSWLLWEGFGLTLRGMAFELSGSLNAVWEILVPQKAPAGEIRNLGMVC